MSIDSLKMDTIIALQEADRAGQRMLGAGITKVLFLKNVVMFSESFNLSPAAILTAQFQDDKHYVLYAQILKTLIENIALLYELSEKEVMAVMDETATELLGSFKQQLEIK